jgi:hypothetical protein
VKFHGDKLKHSRRLRRVVRDGDEIIVADVSSR